MDGTDGLAWSLLPGLGFIRAKEENERFKAEGERHLASGFCYCYIRNYIYKEIYRAGDEGGRLNACWFLCYYICNYAFQLRLATWVGVICMTSASPVSASAGSASRVLARLLLGSEGEPAELSTKRPPSTHYSYGEGEPARAREMAFEEGLEVRAMYYTGFGGPKWLSAQGKWPQSEPAVIAGASSHS